MNLQQQLTEDMKAAMKGKDMKTLDVVRMVIASVKNKAIELNKELDDAEVIAVIKADAKKIKDALDSFVTSAREDLADSARAELKILEKYLPEQLQDADLEKIVRAKVAELGLKAEDAGRAMGTLAKELKDKADGSRIKAMLDKVLNG